MLGMVNEPLPDYLTIAQAATYLNVSAQTLRRWDAEGKITSIRHPGNSYRYFKKSDIEFLRLDYSRAEQEDPTLFFAQASANIIENERLRKPQIEAYQALRDHFQNQNSHAILQIPVGCGKTGIMAIAPFGISQGRVLIVAPNKTIRTGIAEALEIGSAKFFLGKTKVLPSYLEGPFAAILDGPRANIHDCIESHYVVTNIQQLASSADRWLPQFPPSFFDMILVDEGHHNVAESWKKVFDRFPGAKVVSLTATPFRSDGQPLSGEVVYRYSYSNAMMAGYIKQIHSVNVAPEEIYFTYRGDEQRHTLEEVLELREEAWFRRGVALAPECNIHIIEASIHRLNEIRAATGHRHQIIAAACSIDHARQIRHLYEQRGIETREIYSEMNSDQQVGVLNDLRDSRIDCVVQVQMLGEGFDHPPLSVAAIFRPYRSLSPYVQFVGRIMRVMPERDPADPANHGYVVSHVGLNNDANWSDFREFDLEDQEIFRLWLEANPFDESFIQNDDVAQSGHGRRFDQEMQVHSEVLSDFLRNSFLDPNDERIIDKMLEAIIPGIGLPFKSIITRDQAKDLLAKAQERVAIGKPEPIPVTPQRRRRAARARLQERSKSIANRVLKDLGYAVVGRHLSKLFPQYSGQPNLKVAICLMSIAVNDFLGIGKNDRNKISSSQAEEALSNLDIIGDGLRDLITERRQK